MRHGENKKIAEWAGLRNPFLSQIFHGYKRPSPKKAEELEARTGIDFRDWLLLPHEKLKQKVYLAWKMSEEQNGK